MENIVNKGMETDSEKVYGIIFDIKEFAVHDGAGVRTTVFFKGCPLRCTWCHNPEGQSQKPELMQKSGCVGCGKCKIPCSHPECAPYGRCLHVCTKGLLAVAGKKVSSSELAEKLSRDAILYEMSGGGVTLSGGEPMMQGEFCLDLLKRLGKMGINRAIETCAYAKEDVFRRIISECDFVYCDLKLADSVEHKKYTGVPNDIILQNIEILRKSKIPYKIRVPLIPGVTDTQHNLEKIKKLTNEDEVQYLPYNKLAGAKYAMLGREYNPFI